MELMDRYTKFDRDEIEQIFSYHPPTPEERETYEAINHLFITCAHGVATLLPDGPGKTVAIRALSEARMKANAAIALKGKF